MNNSWMNDPRLDGLDKDKLGMLQEMANQGGEKNQSELMSFLMAAAASGQSGKPQFAPDEMQLIIEVLKSGKSPKEQARINKIVQLMSLLRRN